jgi:predicted nuclease of restriction endonuclease-like (RecB) superfamily
LSGEFTASHGKVLAGVSQTEQFYYAKQTASQSWSIRALEKGIKQNSNDGANLNKTISKDNHIQQLERKLTDHFCSPVHLEINKKTNKRER